MLIKTLLTSLLVTAALFASDETDNRLGAAATVFEEVMGISDKAIPQKLLDKSHCVVVVPGLKKGAFIIGAKYGRGFVSCRNANGLGWGAPGGVRIEGGSFGLQIGGTETDVVMLIMNERGAKRLLTSKFTIGADAAAAAGPVGRTATAETDALMTAEILTWSRSRGLFAGISLKGSTLRSDRESNKDMYGPGLTNKDILMTTRAAPAPAKPLLDLLSRYSSRRTD